MPYAWFVCGALLAPFTVAAQRGVPPVRPLGPTLATSPVTFGRVSQLVALSDGRVLVADASKRVVLSLDAELAAPIVLLDSAAGRKNSFTGMSYITRFLGDSVLFFDGTAGVYVVIEPDGSLGRAMAPPPRIRSAYRAGAPASSPALGLIHTVDAPPAGLPRVASGQPEVVVQTHDSAYVVRMDFETRELDTLAKISTGSSTVHTIRFSGFGRVGRTALFPFYDEAVVTTDGSVAIFHAGGYRIEWIDSRGERSSGPRLSYPWRAIGDDARRQIVDSINAARTAVFDSMLAKRAADSAAGSPPMMTVITTTTGGHQTELQRPAPPPPPPRLATEDEVPDFHPPTDRDAVRADGDNNVWVLPIVADPDPRGAVWHVIDRNGELTDRVIVPHGSTIAGFGAGGIVYLAIQDADITTLRKVRWR